MKQKSLVLVMILATAFQLANAQNEDAEPSKGFDKSKLFFGGTFGFGLGFGSSTGTTNINVSPQVGYRFNRYFAAGTGINFIYTSVKYPDYYNNVNVKFNYSVVGLNVFGRFYPIKQVFFHLQPELNYNWGKEKFDDGTPEIKLDPKFVPSLLGGIGGAIPTGRNGALIIILEYDLLQKDRNPYGSNPFFSIGYSMGF